MRPAPAGLASAPRRAARRWPDQRVIPEEDALLTLQDDDGGQCDP
jgi:hypothetical protein